MKIKGTCRVSKGSYHRFIKKFKTRKERREDKSYKDVERSHSGLTKNPIYVSTLAQLFLRPCLHGLFKIMLF